MKPQLRVLCRNLLGAGMTASIACLSLPEALAAQTKLADMPTKSAPPAPANLIFTPSVEFPTATVYAHKDGSYSASKEYLGYFDPKKCYKYNDSKQYFEAKEMAGANHSCPNYWSGNALNYATMSGIDPFRWALTGGYRSIDTATSGDTPGVTVLQRSYNSRAAMGGRTIPGANAGSTNINLTSANLGLNAQDTTNTKTYRVAVRVCDNSLGDEYLEDNCVEYRTPEGVKTHKPVGLIQRYQDKMRFGVFSYLYNEYDSAILEGAVMRSRLKNVGVSNWDGTNNSAYEWSPATGVFVTNPDTADATTSAVSNSGVINYLNKFGFAGGGYETFDQPSEMMAEALRYLMNMKPTESYYKPAASDAKRKDGFPVITKWSDPILNACQRNAILGIGDVNTHYESTFGELPFDPIDWTKKLNTLEGVSGLQTASWGNVKAGEPRGGSNMIAGMAYYAHTQNIRTDIATSPDKMTVDFFWVDVMEPSGRGVAGHTEYVHKNQYWLAAKYGGFTDVNNNGAFDPGDTWKTQNRSYFGNELPDNYYLASDPNAMVSGLEAVFSKIGAYVATAKGTGIVWPDGSASTATYMPNYNTKNWSGDVVRQSGNSFVEASGKLSATPEWSAAAKIDAQNWDTERKIVTGTIADDNSFAAVPFRWESLSATQKASFDANSTNQKAILNYLRGSRAEEGTTFRLRDHALGDIVNSKLVYVAAPKESYLEIHNPGYVAFLAAKKNRKEMLYVGANDGMLHAINAGTGETGGQEQWAYVPSFLYRGPSTPATPEVDGLQALSKSSYTHHYYVDATPMVADADFGRTGISWEDSTTPDWRTLLVGGLGKGGKGYFAIDITNPEASTEAIAASKVLWEFSEPNDMGFTYGQALITKTKAWGWVVIAPSGYNNASGKGVLFILNAKTGALIKSVDTGVGTAENPAGFAQIEAYIPRAGDQMASQVYGGDLLGNLWRFDLTDAGGEVKVHKLASLTDAGGKAQPVTVYPTMARPQGGKPDHRWIFIATGQYLATSDIIGGAGSQTQTMYAIRDGGQFTTTPDSAETITRDDLSSTDLMTKFTSTPTKGWYFDMPHTLKGAKERTWVPLKTAPGTITWVGGMPVTPSDLCKNDGVTGESHTYTVDFEAGFTALRDALNNPVVSIKSDQLVIDVNVQYGKDGNPNVLIDEAGETKKPSVQPEKPTKRPPGVMNWRLAN